MQRRLEGKTIQLFCLAVGIVLAACADEIPQHPGLESVSDMVEVPEQARAAGARERRAFAAGGGALLYLNFDGGPITRSYSGSDDAASNVSYIGGGTIPPFDGDQALRDLVVKNVKEIYKDFNIRIVTTRPTSEEYDMAMIGGTPASIGLGYGGITGIAPMDCNDQMGRNIAFVFSDQLARISQGTLYALKVAETTAHESAHTFGLPHSANGCDVMSYSACQQRKEFLDQELNMQSDSYGQCGLYSMNSHQLLLNALGAAAAGSGNPGPQVRITSPAQGATVATRCIVQAAVSGAAAVSSVELLVDGQPVGTRESAPYSFDITLSHGVHQLTVNGYDTDGNKGSAELSIMASADSADQPSLGDSTTGPDLVESALGTHGAPCESGAECATGLCAEIGGSYGRYCTESCRPEANGCPAQVSCVAASSGRFVCGPPVVTMSENAGTSSSDVSGEWLAGGCALTPSARPDAGWVLNGLLLLSLLVSRRRARR